MEIRALGTGDIDAVLDIRARSFGLESAERGVRWQRLADPALAAGRYLGGFDGDRLVATARVIEFSQWWRGRAVSMGGVASVTVAPEDRGRGAGRQIMTAALQRCAELGHPVSMLYPATAPLYRSVGWEHAGARYVIELRAEDLRTLPAAEPVAVRRAGPEDAAQVAATIRRVHEAAGDSGPVDWGEAAWRVFLADERRFYYLADDGFVGYGWADGTETLQVEMIVAGSERTLRALWGIVGSGSSIAKTVRACVGPYDPALWLLRERTTERVTHERWMLRVVDAAAAIAARGYPEPVCAEVPLMIDDLQRPGNAGSWRLTVKGGHGWLDRAPEAPGAIRLAARGLAALYAGVPVSTLRRSSLLDGGAPAIWEALDTAFAAAAFALDDF